MRVLLRLLDEKLGAKPSDCADMRALIRLRASTTAWLLSTRGIVAVATPAWLATSFKLAMPSFEFLPQERTPMSAAPHLAGVARETRASVDKSAVYVSHYITRM